MEPFRHHVYVCTQQKPEGAPSCPAKGAEDTLAALRSELGKAGLADEVQVTTCGCLGLCEQGPNLVVYPEGAWYAHVGAADVPELVSEHFAGGRPVARLLAADAAAMKKEILDHNRKVKALKEMMEKAGFAPDELSAVMRGFMESRALLTAIELDLFSAVGAGSTAQAAAERMNTDPRATASLLNALAAVKALTKEGEVYKNAPLTARFLAQGSPDDTRTAAMHIVNLWPRWSTLTECVKQGTSVAIQSGERRGEDATVAFIAAMHKNASFRAPQVAGALDLAGVDSVLDLGGGSGAYAVAFARKKPGMAVTVFDLPIVVPLTQKYIAEAGLEARIKTIAGDMQKDPYGTDYGLIFISAICHMFSPEENLALFNRIRSALKDGGQFVIQDFILGDDKTAPRTGALFALNMLVNTRGGSAYSGKEYVEWLTQAGFKDAKVVALPGPTSLVTARK
ncbi:MAG TPA: methyltransferase [bacterium]|nr:methyltransferase [bacterium]